VREQDVRLNRNLFLENTNHSEIPQRCKAGMKSKNEESDGEDEGSC
jgi:hypothetical protein